MRPCIFSVPIQPLLLLLLKEEPPLARYEDLTSLQKVIPSIVRKLSKRARKLIHHLPALSQEGSRRRKLTEGMRRRGEGRGGELVVRAEACVFVSMSTIYVNIYQENGANVNL